MNQMKKLLFCLGIGMISPSLLFAQESAEKPNDKIKERMAWFIYTSLPEGVENPVSIMSGNDIIEVTLSKRSPSLPVKIPADGILKMVRKIENPTDPEKNPYLTLAQTTVSDQIEKALIILIPSTKDPKEPLFETKVQNLAEIKGGDWMFLNATNHKVGVDMNKTEILVGPGEAKTYTPESNNESIQMSFRYSVTDADKESWKTISSSSVSNYSTRREICIFTWDSKYNRISYHGMSLPAL
jgi:hypothetical protein